ncbi:CoA pyrophosphatase [Pseudidiomarina tainanensis]|uniref:8-oxo-dGTP pyrophosphatase MutT, NUDIX family n=2 Tax=Pseudidiomarina TaxID=2800384 RepID=A0A1I6G451_9GAMM|nr:MULTISPECIES: CoA pyrophosphatase [Pseudidiomarina]RZQ57192.1 CoA pyrophosphatase [Pseudidiomarina tainanensis]SFR36921.1 8-oxo-dGTP pyrophosphatase MutT, NUDIX family [Pseudidiomarina maritima]
MTRHDFLRRFQLHPAPNIQRPLIKRLRPAAVLVPLFEDNGELHLILTQRSAQLRHHAGQISFPGGRQEPHDRDLYATAVREAQEEIGLQPEDITLVGQLHDYPVMSNFLIRPYVVLINPRQPLQRDHREVAEIFTVPLREVLHQNKHYVYRLRRFIYDQVYFIPYQQRNIWGATAGILRELADHVYPERQFIYRPLND